MSIKNSGATIGQIVWTCRQIPCCINYEVKSVVLKSFKVAADDGDGIWTTECGFQAWSSEFFTTKTLAYEYGIRACRELSQCWKRERWNLMRQLGIAGGRFYK